jgi:Fe2+ or Zn2+ uptake regulation protein
MKKVLKKENDAGMLLKAHGLRVTPARLAIMAALDHAHEPLSIEAILAKLPKKTADQATVYRTLESFKEKGLVRQVVLSPERALYERAGDDHHHIVCTRCGRIEHIELPDCGRFEQRALKESAHFARIERHALELYGRCKSCI